MERLVLILVCLILVGAVSADAETPAPASLSLPFVGPDAGWEHDTSGAFTGRVDRRDLFVLGHPWAPSQSGAHTVVHRRVTIPDPWRGPVRLHLYLGDDYDGVDAPLGADEWLSQVRLVGHRFKQILVDDEVIWERDVADDADIGAATRISMVLPERVRPGSTVDLAIRLVDRVGSGERLEGDHLHAGGTDGIDADAPWRFMTHLFVGDVVLAPEGVQVEPSASPAIALVRERHDRAWPLPPFGDGAGLPLRLPVEGALPAAGGALRCGLPLPAGQVRDVSALRLRDDGGALLAAQWTPMNRWPDGSLRWVEVDVQAPPGLAAATISVEPDGEPPAAVGPVVAEADPEGGWRLSERS